MAWTKNPAFHYIPTFTRGMITIQGDTGRIGETLLRKHLTNPHGNLLSLWSHRVREGYGTCFELPAADSQRTYSERTMVRNDVVQRSASKVQKPKGETWDRGLRLRRGYDVCP